VKNSRTLSIQDFARGLWRSPFFWLIASNSRSNSFCRSVRLTGALSSTLTPAGTCPVGWLAGSTTRRRLLAEVPAPAFAANGMLFGSWVPRIPADGLSLEALEKELILQSLERAAGNKSAAARLLGLTRRTLYSRMEKHGLHTPGEGEDGEADAEP